ncbi:MAG: hypothetical protein H0T62_08230 [Parachlamydiaceae bacterium]|nr:hypothetical protein [Parachlamydiaceae bacterium]
MDSAQKKAIEAKNFTTFTATLALDTTDGRKMLIVGGMGDSPAAIRKKDGMAELLTPDIKKYTTSDTDPGGQMGCDSMQNQKNADLRNLFMTVVIVEERDTLVMGSDGMFDNLDPEMSNLTPFQAFQELRGPGKSEGLKEPNLEETWDHFVDRLDSQKKRRNWN